ncbi:MAG: VOC family protein [Caulobacteraceae bacterium]|nr:VOC family protein [Caulobacteraceae bacterium]
MAEGEPLVSVLGLSHVVLRVSDLNRAIDYYDRLFGFRIHSDKRNAMAEGASPSVVGVLAGRLAVEIIETTAPIVRRARDEPGYVCIAFGVADAAAALEILKSRGLTRFPEVATTPSGHKAVLFRDPDGNILEFIEIKGAPTMLELAMAGAKAQ